MKERYDGRLQNVFSDFICSEVERINGDELWACLSFIVMKEGGAMERNGCVWETIEWLRCFSSTLYILMFCLVSLRESESKRSF